MLQLWLKDSLFLNRFYCSKEALRTYFNQLKYKRVLIFITVLEPRSRDINLLMIGLLFDLEAFALSSPVETIGDFKKVLNYYLVGFRALSKAAEYKLLDEVKRSAD